MLRHKKYMIFVGCGFVLLLTIGFMPPSRAITDWQESRPVYNSTTETPATIKNDSFVRSAEGQLTDLKWLEQSLDTTTKKKGPQLEDENRSVEISTYNQSSIQTTSIARVRILTTPKSQVAPDADPSVITILLWTKKNPDTKWWYVFRDDFGRHVFGRHNCTHTNCNLIDDRSRLNESDFVMFHYDDPPEWPEIRYTWQSYIHIMKERPGPWHYWLKDYEARINITMSYRHDSDIQFYNNGFHKRKHPLQGPYIVKHPLATRNKSAVWMVSHCGADSKRDDYVEELSKYIDVDIYGNCGPLECPKGRNASYQCLDSFQKQYKFYLAFENAFCKDYVTEKLYRTLEYELIPVVLGAANYSRAAPPHSVIDVRDFDSPKALAKYLKYLANHEQEYYKYFEWKQSYAVLSLQDCYCTLCDALNDPAIANKKAGGYYDWWFSGCDNTVVDMMKHLGGW